jgi:hypothetical protein
MFDNEIPQVLTSFQNFELEEKVVRLVARMGYPVVARQIRRDELAASVDFKLLFTDLEKYAGLGGVIIPKSALGWSERGLQDFISQRIFNFTRSNKSLESQRSLQVVITGSESYRSLIHHYQERFSEMYPVRAHFPFSERDIQLALIPTRRRDEIERVQSLQESGAALFVTTLRREELDSAHSFIEYRRRIHPHLSISFLVIEEGATDSIKKLRSTLIAQLHPFPFFSISPRALIGQGGQRNLFDHSHYRRSEATFAAIGKWLGSLCESSQRSPLSTNGSDLGATRASRRVGSRMATFS